MEWGSISGTWRERSTDPRSRVWGWKVLIGHGLEQSRLGIDAQGFFEDNVRSAAKVAERSAPAYRRRFLLSKITQVRKILCAVQHTCESGIFFHELQRIQQSSYRCNQEGEIRRGWISKHLTYRQNRPDPQHQHHSHLPQRALPWAESEG